MAQDRATPPKQPSRVREMFDAIAFRYDLANAVLSLGLHRYWRHLAAGRIRGGVVVDLCTGTGDLARCLAARREVELLIGVDFSRSMLWHAQRKLKRKVSLMQGDAMRLPLPSSIVDYITIGFGLRNLVDPVAGLAEMRRVVKKSGRVIILEFGRLPQSAWGRTFAMYSRHVLPRIGGMITRNPDAYRYLERTSAEFPSGDEFVQLAKRAGFIECRVTKLAGGVVFLYECGGGE